MPPREWEGHNNTCYLPTKASSNSCHVMSLPTPHQQSPVVLPPKTTEATPSCLDSSHHTQLGICLALTGKHVLTIVFWSIQSFAALLAMPIGASSSSISTCHTQHHHMNNVTHYIGPLILSPTTTLLSPHLLFLIGGVHAFVP